jgi:hypothetical protein
MNTKVALGLLAGAIVLMVGYFFFVAPTMAPSETATTTVPSFATSTIKGAIQPSGSVAPGSKGATLTTGTPTQVSVKGTVHIDEATLTSSDAYPKLTGTSNVSVVGIVISDHNGTGIVGAGEIPVVNGHWEYLCSVALQPGTYYVAVSAGATNDTQKLVITAN